MYTFVLGMFMRIKSVMSIPNPVRKWKVNTYRHRHRNIYMYTFVLGMFMRMKSVISMPNPVRKWKVIIAMRAEEALL